MMLKILCLLQLLLLAATYPLATLALLGAFDRVATPEAVRMLWLDIPLFMGTMWAWIMVEIVRAECRRVRSL